jgi:hypothetical protein
MAAFEAPYVSGGNQHLEEISFLTQALKEDN